MKDKLRTPTDEQEMCINYCPDMGDMCEIYTTIPWLMKYLEKLVNKYSDTCEVLVDDQYSYTVTVPFKFVKPKGPRILSDEQKEIITERLAKARSVKNINKND